MRPSPKIRRLKSGQKYFFKGMFAFPFFPIEKCEAICEEQPTANS